MKLLRVVQDYGKSRLSVLCDDNGVTRLIVINWYRKEDSDIPPVDWLVQVEGECKYQRDQESLKKMGRILL